MEQVIFFLVPLSHQLAPVNDAFLHWNWPQAQQRRSWQGEKELQTAFCVLAGQLKEEALSWLLVVTAFTLISLSVHREQKQFEVYSKHLFLVSKSQRYIKVVMKLSIVKMRELKSDFWPSKLLATRPVRLTYPNSFHQLTHI